MLSQQKEKTMLHPHLYQYAELYSLMLKIDEAISSAGIQAEVVSDFQDLNFDPINPNGGQNQTGYIHSAGVQKPIELAWKIFYESDNENQGALQISVELIFRDNDARDSTRCLQLTSDESGNVWQLRYINTSSNYAIDPGSKLGDEISKHFLIEEVGGKKEVKPRNIKTLVEQMCKHFLNQQTA
ncbi:hypothetical protein GF391_01350 [Candidatus Uhrbacteria bacterium]|nr:hypothetical protein [Candidatus Uhrbacteria bacterium]